MQACRRRKVSIDFFYKSLKAAFSHENDPRGCHSVFSWYKLLSCIAELLLLVRSCQSYSINNVLLKDQINSLCM